jgi:hypothetical protein
VSEHRHGPAGAGHDCDFCRQHPGAVGLNVRPGPAGQVGITDDAGRQLFTLGSVKARPEEVIDVHLQLAARLQAPRPALVEFTQGFATAMADRASRRDAYYPCDPATPQGAEQFLRHLAGQLRLARTYQVTRNMVTLAQQLFADAKQTVTRLEEAEMPSDYGFMWLDESPDAYDADGRKTATHVITWGRQGVPAGGGREERIRPGVRLTFWTLWEPSAAGTAQVAAMRELGNLTFSHTVALPFGERFGPPAAAGYTDSIAALVHVIWMLMDMPVVTEQREAPLARPARRRAARTLKHGTVNVVTLRRAKRDPSGEPAPVRWSCRWIVQGHWRHYKDGTRTWIRPYLKGPDGLAIRDTSQLWRLSR